MSSSLTKRELGHLASLARIEIDPKEEEKLLKDLGAILDYFNALQALDTSVAAPMTGGMELKNVFRKDGGSESTNRGAGVDSFPESEKGFLKVPAVFEKDHG